MKCPSKVLLCLLPTPAVQGVKRSTGLEPQGFGEDPSQPSHGYKREGGLERLNDLPKEEDLFLQSKSLRLGEHFFFFF